MSERYAYEWLVKKGYLPHQAAGVVGNLVQESGVRPSGVTGDNGTAHGVAQWRGPRFQGLQNYAAQNGGNWQNLDTQLGYLDHELNTTEKSAGDALRASTDVRGATRAFMGFERPQGYTAANPEAGHGFGNRLAAASRLAGEPQSIAGSFGPMPQAQPMMPPGPNPADSILAAAFADQNQDAMRQRQEAAAVAARKRALFGQVGSLYA